MARNMRGTGGGFSGSHRSAIAREMSRAAAAADFGAAARKANKAARAAAYHKAMERAMAKAQLGRMGAFGIPGRAPRLPYRPGFVPRLPGPYGIATSLALQLAWNNMGDWMKLQDGSAPGYDLTGWNVVCTSDPNNFPLEQNFKVGINPGALIGTTNVSAQTCTVSSANTANAAQGVTIPVGATYFQAVQSSQPMPNRNGRVWMRASFPGGSINPVPYGTGGPAISAPMSDGVPTPSETSETSYGSVKGTVGKTATAVLGHPVPMPQPLGGDTGGAGSSGDWSPVPGNGPTPIDVPDPDGSEAPYEEPSTDVVGTPGGGFEPPTRGVHVNQPPDRHTREIKWKLPHSKLGDFYGLLTELKDFLEVLDDAIPGNPCHGLGLHKQFACVMQNLHRVDPTRAVGGFVANQFEDFAIGKMNQLANQITKNQYYRRPVGVGAGSFGTRMR